MVNFVFHIALLVCCAIHIQGKGSDKSDSSEIDEESEKFKETNLLKYEDQTKEWSRKENFAKAQRRIRKHNRNKNATYKMAINQFATLDKFLSHSPGLKTKESSLIYSSAEDLPETRQQPTSVDYRNHPCMQPVKKQGDCGDCWAYTATAVVEFSACIINNETGVNLSEQQMTDCSTANFGCFGGYYDEAWKYVAAAGYQATSASYPDIKYRGPCKFNKNTVKGAVVSKTNQVIVISPGDTTTMINLLNAKRLLAVSIVVVDSFMYYGSGVYTEPNCGISIPSAFYHSVTIVGYGVTTGGIEFWVIRNSWSTSWGMNGYGLFQRGNNTCQIETYAATTTVIR